MAHGLSMRTRHVQPKSVDQNLDGVQESSTASALGQMTMTRFNFGRAFHANSLDVGINFRCPELLVISRALSLREIGEARTYMQTKRGGL